MSDPLVKRLQESGLRSEVELYEDREEAADRIEELEAKLAEYKMVAETLDRQWAVELERADVAEAKLAEANMKLAAWKAWASGEPSNPPKTSVTPTNIADIKGQDDE